MSYGLHPGEPTFSDGQIAAMVGEPVRYTLDATNGFLTVVWPQANAVCRERLGHDHQGDVASDQALLDALLEAGAPRAIREAEGFCDELGWHLILPRGGAK